MSALVELRAQLLAALDHHTRTRLTLASLTTSLTADLTADLATRVNRLLRLVTRPLHLRLALAAWHTRTRTRRRLAALAARTTLHRQTHVMLTWVAHVRRIRTALAALVRRREARQRLAAAVGAVGVMARAWRQWSEMAHVRARELAVDARLVRRERVLAAGWRLGEWVARGQAGGLRRAWGRWWARVVEGRTCETRERRLEALERWSARCAAVGEGRLVEQVTNYLFADFFSRCTFFK